MVQRKETDYKRTTEGESKETVSQSENGPETENQEEEFTCLVWMQK